MNPEENPYAAPQAPGLAKAEPPEGALWYVSEGVLHVRDGASLPDVCLSGASPTEAGERKDLDIAWCPAGARHLPSLAFGAFLIWAIMLLNGWSTLPGNSVFIAVGITMIFLITLVRGLSKRGRLHLFQSHQAKRNESRRDWIEGVIVLAFILGGGSLLNRLTGNFISQGGGLIGGTSVFFAGSVRRWWRLRTCGFESGWFTLTNVHPSAVARLQEIQGRLEDPPLSRKPS